MLSWKLAKALEAQEKDKSRKEKRKANMNKVRAKSHWGQAGLKARLCDHWDGEQHTKVFYTDLLEELVAVVKKIR